MTNDKDDDLGAIGRRIGLRLLASRTATANPAVAIRQLITELVAQFPGVKLPQLTADTELQTWMAGRQITKGQLRTALTEARRAHRKTGAAGSVRRPPKPRTRRSSVVSPPDTPAPMLPGFVPNRSLDEL